MKRSVIKVFDLEQSSGPVPVLHVEVSSTLIVFHFDFMPSLVHEDRLGNRVRAPVEIASHVPEKGVLLPVNHNSTLEKVVARCSQGQVVHYVDELLVGQVEVYLHVWKLLPRACSLQWVGIGDVHKSLDP